MADYVIGVVLLVDYFARWWASDDRVAYITRPVTVIDLAVIISLFAPAMFESFTFLRVVRTLRLARFFEIFCA